MRATLVVLGLVGLASAAPVPAQVHDLAATPTELLATLKYVLDAIPPEATKEVAAMVANESPSYDTIKEIYNTHAKNGPAMLRELKALYADPEMGPAVQHLFKVAVTKAPHVASLFQDMGMAVMPLAAHAAEMSTRESTKVAAKEVHARGLEAFGHGNLDHLWSGIKNAVFPVAQQAAAAIQQRVAAL
jgi:hypothetical protein